MCARRTARLCGELWTPAGVGDEEDWPLLRPNLELVGQFRDWFDVLHGETIRPKLSHHGVPGP